MNLRAAKIFLLLCLWDPSALHAQQPSVIEQMIRIKPALVEVTALNSGMVNGPTHTALAKDPRTGKIVAVQTGAQVASYERHGAGVILHESGVIVTNAHVVNQANKVRVLLNNRDEHSAAVVRFAPELDLALLKINVPAPLPHAALADSSTITLHDEVFSVGSSPLLKESISGGKITGLASSRHGAYTNPYESDFFQTSMSIYKGDSGGPLFNRQGQLVGLLTAKLISQNNSSFAVSSNKIARYLNDYLKASKKP